MSQRNTQITFTDEQAMLLETATEFCRDKSPIPAVRTLLTSQHGFNPTVWNDMVALGWSAIAIPERHGGSGLSLAEVATLAEPMGRHLLATPYAGTQIAVQALLAGASPPMQAAILPRIAQGAIATTALFEPDGDWDLTHPETTATQHNGTLTLNGTKTLVENAAVADLLLISVTLDNAPALVLLEANTSIESLAGC